jgi:hypothetical protein
MPSLATRDECPGGARGNEDGNAGRRTGELITLIDNSSNRSHPGTSF